MICTMLLVSVQYGSNPCDGWALCQRLRITQVVWLITNFQIGGDKSPCAVP